MESEDTSFESKDLRVPQDLELVISSQLLLANHYSVLHGILSGSVVRDQHRASTLHFQSTNFLTEYSTSKPPQITSKKSVTLQTLSQEPSSNFVILRKLNGHLDVRLPGVDI